jgi:hypothetical protein
MTDLVLLLIAISLAFVHTRLADVRSTQRDILKELKSARVKEDIQ